MKLFWTLLTVAGLLSAGCVSTTQPAAADGKSTVTSTPPAIRPDLPKIPDRTFNVREHGAKGDGIANDTAALQAAIDAARQAGGGIVEVPAGAYLSGPLQLTSNLNLHLARGATLTMLPLDQYPGGTQRGEDFLSGANLHDLALTGAGTIDGQGEPWWPFAKTASARRPRMFKLSGCERVLVEGVTLKNSPMFHIAFSGCANVTVRGVTIRAPASTDPKTPSHNTDACDVSGHTILVEHCDISVGDDNYTCGGNTHDVLIQHNTYGNGHGVSIGSYTNGGVSNITVRDCTFTGTDCGIRIKSDRGRGGLVENLVYEDLKMKDVNFPILIYGSYMAKEREYRDLNKLTPEIAARYPGQTLAARTPVYRNFTFRNITATAAKGRRAGLIWGLPEAPVTNILLQNVSIQADLPFGIYNAENVRFEKCTITTPDGVNKLSTANAKVMVTP
jgi:polygalacturonase